MKLLLDTCAILWLAAETSRLSQAARDWWNRAVAHHGLGVLSVTDEIALRSTALPPLHADPCDRIIVATAEKHDATIITSDGLIRQYQSITVIW